MGNAPISGDDRKIWREESTIQRPHRHQKGPKARHVLSVLRPKRSPPFPLVVWEAFQGRRLVDLPLP